MEPEEIGGRYSILARIGKGAMGVVYKAYDPVLDRVVAIKKMASEIGQDEELRQRFYVEARAAARLNHRHIVTIHELEESHGEIYIVMELLEGVDLASVLRSKAVLPLEAKLSIVSQLCEGLDYAHRHGIVHRDVKPGNIHLSPAGLVKILDFGIARLASSKMTGTGALLGTPDYMSPEQVMGESIDSRSDLFAVGGVLYELLAGTKPFESDTVASLLIKIAKNPHVPITDRVPDLPIALISLVNRLLAKDRDQRPPTAAAVVEEIRAYLQDLSTSDTAAAAMIGGAVTEQTVMISKGPAVGTPRPLGAPSTPPATPRPASTLPTVVVPPTVAPTASASDGRLASLALQRGRELRKSGDLAGAMQVFRSVLEVAPGNAEALEELQALESDLRQATTGPAEPGSVAVEAATILSPPATAKPPATQAPAVGAPPAAPAPVAPLPVAAAPAIAPAATRKSGAGLMIATLLVVLVGGAGGAYYLLVLNKAASQPTAPAPTTSIAAVPQTTTSAALPPVTTSAPPVAEEKPPPETASSTPASAAVPPPAPEPVPPAAPAAPRPPAVDPERVKAEAARDRLAQAKQMRAASSMPMLPARVRNEAVRFERQGTMAFADSKYARASVLFDEATQIYVTRSDGRGRMGAATAAPAAARADATASPTPAPAPPPGRRTVEPAQAEPPGRSTTPAPAGRGDTTPPPPQIPATPRDRNPDISTFTKSQPTSVNQMFNATPSARATAQRIVDTIERYARAIEQRDGETLRTLRSELNPLELRILRYGKSIVYKLDDVKVAVDGSDGLATARRSGSAEFQSGEKITFAEPATIRLSRRPAGWVITDVR